jgi:hypothetical protein
MEEIRQDFDRHTVEEQAAAFIMMKHCCAQWDRPHYLYVRLSEREQILVKGFDGMCGILRSFRKIFRFGENFCCRFDESNPVQASWNGPEGEPTLQEAASHLVLPNCEENPYLTPRELATVFHYVAPPDGAPVGASHFLDSSSPAMRQALPPRIVSLLQLFPDLFYCRETSPGVFTIRRVEERGTRPAHRYEDGRADALSGSEVVSAVRAMVPAAGVELSTLDLWLSHNVKTAISTHFGTLEQLVQRHPAIFQLKKAKGGDGESGATVVLVGGG